MAHPCPSCLGSTLDTRKADEASLNEAEEKKGEAHSGTSVGALLVY